MSPRRAALAVDLFTAAVIASVAIALAGLTWRVAAGVARSPVAPAAPAVAMPRGDVDIAPIVTLAPFGNGATGAPQPTTLPIELRGLILAVPAGASSALIAPTGGTPVTYRIGQPLAGGGTIESIAIDHVIIAIGGHREILAFPVRGAPPPAAVPGGPAPTAVAAPGTGTAPATAALAASPQALLDSFGASPINGGYRVGEQMSPSIRQAGMQPGDIITQVNGTQLGNPAMDQQLLAAAMRSGTVRVDIMRGDRHIVLAFPFR